MAAVGASVLDDPRWRAFNAQGLSCSCGERHVGLFPIHIETPVNWPGPFTYETDEALRMDGNFLSSSFCVMEGKYFAMRMRLPLQMQGAQPSAFLFTVWASVNRPDFEAYVDARRNKRLSNTVKFPARLANRLSGYPETVRLAGTAIQQEDGGLPLLLVHGGQPPEKHAHPLVRDQHQGIGVYRMLELFGFYGHSMRPEQAEAH